MMRHCFLGAAVVWLLVPCGAHALQSLDRRSDQEMLSGQAPVDLSVAGAECLTPLIVTPPAPVRRPACTVEALVLLDDADGPPWYVAQYRRSASVEWGQPSDSVEWDEVVLLSGMPQTDSVVPTWHMRTERAIEFLSGVRAHRRAEGLLIEVLVCLNGTGGCAREYLLWTGSALEYVHAPFAADLQAMLTDGRRLHAGMTLDMDSLRGTWPVQSPGDANCCPSLIYEYSVRLQGTELVLVSSSLRPVGGPPSCVGEG